MNQIEKQYFKETESLDAVSFFQFLVKEGHQLSLITTEQLERLQYQVVQLLTDQFNRWTGGQSSSVPVETGQRIQQSAFYTIGYYLKGLPDAETGLKMLIEKPLPDLYEFGKKLIEEDFRNAKTQLQSIQSTCLTTDVLAYNDTIHEGLPIFFSSYDIDYGAHESPGSIDYPLSNDKMNLTGIDYTCEYLHKLELENQFCSYFSAEEIHSLLRGYDPHYKDLLFNIYELILTNAIGCLLLGKDEVDLQIKDYDRQYLMKELSDLPEPELDRSVDHSVSRLCRLLIIENTELEQYIKRSAVNLKSRLKNALEIKELNYMFLTMKDINVKPMIHFEDRLEMDPEEFRIFADEIRECRFIADKIRLMKKRPLSMADLIGLLEGDCFFEEEYYEVFLSLEDIQLALLVKELPLDPVDSSFQSDERSKDWHCFLDTFLNETDQGRKASILKAAELIEFRQSD